MPFFFDLSSLLPTVERNPFEPLLVADALPTAPLIEAVAAEPLPDAPEDRGLPIPPRYDVDLMRALVQDPFHLFVHWQLKDNPFERLRRMFPRADAGTFQTVLKLIDETNRIAVLFPAAFTHEYWFDVHPDRAYRVELGVRSPQLGYIKLLSSQTVSTPRGAPSAQSAEEPAYHIAAEEYLQVLRDSHLVPERALTAQGLLPPTDVALWEAFPDSFRQFLHAVADAQAGRDYDRFWERLEAAQLSEWVREFLATIQQMGSGELGYLLLLRYLPEVLRRAINAELGQRGEQELEIDRPITLYLAEKLGQSASEQVTQRALPGRAPGSIAHGEWLPSMQH